MQTTTFSNGRVEREKTDDVDTGPESTHEIVRGFKNTYDGGENEIWRVEKRVVDFHDKVDLFVLHAEAGIVASAYGLTDEQADYVLDKLTDENDANIVRVIASVTDVVHRAEMFAELSDDPNFEITGYWSDFPLS